MNIRNYTSGVTVDRSVALIERKLVEGGACHIAKSYEKGALEGITFTLSGPGGRFIPIRLPANVDGCERQLASGIKRPRKGTMAKIREQAERTAWKLLSDWVDVQISMIHLQQAEPLEIFLPYVFDGKQDRTFYEALKDGEFKALPFSS